jgi:putative oxidoreductase
MSKIPMIARIIQGLIFTLFSINFFIPFLPPMEPNEQAGAFIGALIGSGYLFHFMKVVELICGIMLLIGFRVQLALVLLAPIVLNIFLFHAFLEPTGLPVGILIMITEIYLAYHYREAYAGILCPPKATESS